MKLTSFCQWLSIGLGVIALSGCNMAQGPGGSSVATGVPGAGGDNANAKAYGLNTNSGVSGQSDNAASSQGVAGDAASTQGQRVINSVRAPENQTYYFTFNSYVVNQSDMSAVMAQANYLVQHPNAQVRLEGNTDDRGSREYNIALGWSRDKAVLRLLEQQGVAAKQIVMVSYGKERPAVVGDNEAAWALNRCVNLVYERT
jgi:peptidoglycan-associated lipoprotein